MSKFAAATALFALASSASAQVCTPKPDARVFGHRGNSWDAPENTLEAFMSTLALGATANELDTYITRDDVLVVIHDSTVDRTTDGTGRVSDYTLAELRRLDAGYRFTRDNGATYPFRGQGIQIPTMREVFEKVPTGLINIDLKSSDFERSVRLLLADIEATGVDRSRIIAGGFNDATTNYLREQSPETNTMAPQGEVVGYTLAFLLNATETYEPIAQRYQVPNNLTPDVAGFVGNLNRRGALMDFWTINDPNDMRTLFCGGADGIITDRVDLALQVRDELFKEMAAKE